MHILSYISSIVFFFRNEEELVAQRQFGQTLAQ